MWGWVGGAVSHVMLVLMLAGYVGAGGGARTDETAGVYDNGLDILLLG